MESVSSEYNGHTVGGRAFIFIGSAVWVFAGIAGVTALGQPCPIRRWGGVAECVPGGGRPRPIRGRPNLSLSPSLVVHAALGEKVADGLNAKQSLASDRARAADANAANLAFACE